MLLEIIRKLNWVDLVIIILLFRIGYVSLKNGFSLELFKLLGTAAAIYLSLHYYTFCSDWVGGRTPFLKRGMPLEYLDFICFIALALLGYLIFMGLRFAFYRFIKLEAVPRLNKWGGLVLGAIRGSLLVSLITVALVTSTIGYLKESAVDSYFGRRLFRVAPAAYSWLWQSIFSKFAKGEKFNNTIFEVAQGLKL